MFCRKCGKEIPDDSLFCPKCGTPTDESTAPAGETQSPKTESPTPPAEDHEPDVNAFTSSYEYRNSYIFREHEEDTSATVVVKKKSSKRKTAVVLGIIGALVIIGVVIIIIIANANNSEYPDFKYHLADDGTYVIDKYVGATGVDIDIPKTIDDIPVTKVADKAFYEADIVNVTFDYYMKEIGESAFEGSKISSVTFNDPGLFISYEVPEEYRSICDLPLKIGNNAFKDCENLSNVTVPFLTDVNLGRNAFYGCSMLKNVTLRKVLEMGESAFANSGLETASVGGYLGTAAFADCKNLVEFNVRNGTAQIAPRLFENCTALVRVNWDIDLSEQHSILQDAFSGCTELKEIRLSGLSVTYPRQMKEIVDQIGRSDAYYITYDDQAFKDCQYFKDPAGSSKSQYLPISALDIGALTYARVVKLFGKPTYITIPNKIGAYQNLNVGCSNIVDFRTDETADYNRIDYAVVFGGKETLIDKSIGMHLGEGPDYYSKFMDFNVRNSLKHIEDYLSECYEFTYQKKNDGKPYCSVTVRFDPDTYVSYAVKVEFLD